MKIINTNFAYRQALIPLNYEKVIFLIVHHCAAITQSPEDIHMAHLNNGWNGFGYNEYIRKDGTVYIGRGDNIGAHCLNMNSKSYGICCEGNYQVEVEMPESQFKSLVERLKYHKDRFKNVAEIAPHKRFMATQCPGKNFPLDKAISAVTKSNDDFSFEKAVQVLERYSVINTPGYWLNAVYNDEKISKEYIKILIENMAKKLT